MKISTWLAEIRANFLALSVILAIYGIAIAYSLTSGNVRWFYSIIAGVGLVLLHISVNLFNEYFDFRSGIDQETLKTPFSGGSGILPSGELSPKSVLIVALVTLFAGSAIGIFLTFRIGIYILYLGILGILFIVGYNTFFAKIMLGEIAAGLGLGSLPVLGIQYITTQQFSLSAIIASVPAGFLVFNLLLLNEFPDAIADKKGGRRHLVIIFGKKRAAWIYTMVISAVFAWIFVCVAFKIMPLAALLGLLTIPFGIKAALGALKNYDSNEKLLPAQGINVVLTLVTQVLLAVGYFLSN